MVKKKPSEQESKENMNINEPAENVNDKTGSKNQENNGQAELDNEVEPDVNTGEKSEGNYKADKSEDDKGNVLEKLAEMQDKYLRLSAEFDNYRKRTLREKIELSKYAAEDLILKLLPVMDDFERALTHMDNATDCNSMKEGIALIHNKFTDFLKQNGIKEIDALNCNFDVDLHDAVAKTPVDENDRKGRIVDVVLKGYYLDDKVIRHSKVVIGE